MDYQELLDRADYNTETKFQAPVKPPNKKLSKSGVKSDGIQRFLAKRKAEEEARAAKAQKEKEQLLALRAQNSKNNKKAKIMASRTKDNDFSRIRLTEDEIEAKKKIENEIQRKHLIDKVERMKTRIDLEEKEKLLPRKRKRKSKLNGMDEDFHREQQIKEDARESRDSEKNNSDRKKQRPPAPPPSYMELLKLAEAKMHEPIVIPKKEKKEERLLTKKERKLYEEEKERQRRKQERLERGDSLASYRNAPPPPAKHSSADKKGAHLNGKMPLPAKNPTNGDQPPKFKIPKQNVQQPDRKGSLNGIDKTKLPSSSNPSKTSLAPKPHTNHNREQISKNSAPVEKKPQKQPPKGESRPVPKLPVPEKALKKKVPKIAPAPPPPPPPAPQVDTAALAAEIAKQVRQDLEKKLEAKYEAKIKELMEKEKAAKPKVPVKPKPSGSEGKMLPPANGPPRPPQQPLPTKKDPGRMIGSKPVMKVQKRPLSPPAKKPFHINPYLDAPRKVLNPIRPQKPPQKRRIESDDDDDDDMSDFIDDGPSQNDEDYSKYIKEIFGYDRSRYVDEDEDDIMETSFAEQMKEETRSAKLGFLEDLEEERKLREQEKKWRQKHKK